MNYKKNYYILIFAILSLYSCSKSNSRIRGINGKVERINTIQLNILSDSLNHLKFDTASNEILLFNNKGVYKESTTRYYNNGEITLIENVKYQYQKNNLLKKQIIKTNKDYGNCVVNYLYNDTLIDKVFSTSENRKDLEFIAKYYYQKNGKIDHISQINFYTDSIKNNSVIISKQYDKYDKDENISISIDSSFYSGNVLITKTKYLYNDKKDIVKEIIVKSDNKTNTIEFKYDYDKNGNWFLENEYKNKKLNTITKQIIKYK